MVLRHTFIHKYETKHNTFNGVRFICVRACVGGCRRILCGLAHVSAILEPKGFSRLYLLEKKCRVARQMKKSGRCIDRPAFYIGLTF